MQLTTLLATEAQDPGAVQLILPGTSELLYGAIAFVVIAGFLIGSVVIAFTVLARRSQHSSVRPPCSVGPMCPCDCHHTD